MYYSQNYFCLRNDQRNRFFCTNKKNSFDYISSNGVSTIQYEIFLLSDIKGMILMQNGEVIFLQKSKPKKKQLDC